MNTKHTPGDFEAKNCGGGLFQILAPAQTERYQGVKVCVAEVRSWDCEPPIEQVEGNATLFSAAPDMLEALKLGQRFMANLMKKGNVDFGKTFGLDFGLMNEFLIKQDAAIDKAEGRA